MDGMLGGDETDVDCGGSCNPCENGQQCGASATADQNCISGYCASGTCAPCTGPADCAGKEYCDAGICTPDRPNGQVCMATTGDTGGDSQCESGFCEAVDGGIKLCCDTSCEGACRSCAAADTGEPNGICANATVGTDPRDGCAATGVCQGAAYAGQCGLRLFSRAFPMAGAWSSTALSVAPGWTGANAPPPSAITTAEETSNSSRLMVVRQDGASSTFYQTLGGAWQPPVPLSSLPELGSAPLLASMVSGNFNDQDAPGQTVELAIVTTVNAPLTSVVFEIPSSGPFVTFTPATPIPAPTNPMLCPQHAFPVLWSFIEQRSPAGEANDSVEPRAWKFCNGLVYQEGMTEFEPLDPPALPEAASLLQITGNNGSPAPGTIVAAYYRKATNTVFMIAP
jgi:hypothetical protein